MLSYADRLAAMRETKIKHNIVGGVFFAMSGIFPEGDQTGQRSDQGAGPANIYAHQQRRVVGGELGQQDGRRNIADALTGQNAEN